MPVNNSTEHSANMTLAGSVLVIILVNTFLYTSGMTNPLIMIILSLPLILTLHGQVKRSSRTYQWLCFAILFYMVLGILLAFTATYLFLGLAIALVCVITFISAIIFIRSARIASLITNSMDTTDYDDTSQLTG